MAGSSEKISNNQTILLGTREGSSTTDLFVVNFDSSGNPTVDQIDFENNSLIIEDASLTVKTGSGSFVASDVELLTYTILADTLKSASGIISGTTIDSVTVSFRAAQIISVNGAGDGSVVFGVASIEAARGI